MNVSNNRWLTVPEPYILHVCLSGSYGICYSGVEAAAGRPDREEPGEQEPSQTTAEEVSTGVQHPQCCMTTTTTTI